MKLTELHNLYIMDIFKDKYVNSENFEIMLIKSQKSKMS